MNLVKHRAETARDAWFLPVFRYFSPIFITSCDFQFCNFVTEKFKIA